MSMEKEDAKHNGQISTRLSIPLAATVTETPPRHLRAKKRGVMNVLRVALFMVHRRSTGKKTTAIQYEASQSGKRGLLKNILGAVRPLHQLEDGPPPMPSTPEPDDTLAGHGIPPKEVHLPPPSPSCSEGWFSTDGMSQYASAEDLRSLDTCTEDSNKENTDDEENNDGVLHDIDRRADEFIAKFYEQMRQQRTN